MKKITVEDLMKENLDNVLILDVRKKEDFEKGSINECKNKINAFWENINIDELNLPKDKKIYVMCYTGDTSTSVAEELEEKGYDAASIEGGYREYFRWYLYTTVMAEEKRENSEERRKQIERSIIKKFRKPIWKRFIEAINEYELIVDGDKIAVCISGGKDSMLMAKLFQELYKHGKKNFEVIFLVMNPGYNEQNWDMIKTNASVLGIDFQYFKTEIFDTVAEIENNPCYLCARMRRGYLYSKAKELGCNKIALGHHFDDVVETTLMSMLYSGKIETMLPKLHSRNFEGMELIRPLYKIREDDIKAWRDYNGLTFIQCACRFTEHCVSCGGGKDSKREEMKELVRTFRQKNDIIDKNIFTSMSNINLDTVLGYKKNGVKHSFLDEY